MKIKLFTRNFAPYRFIGADLYDLALMKSLSKYNDVSIYNELHSEAYEYNGISVNRDTEGIDIAICNVDNSSKAFKYSKKVIGIVHNNNRETIDAARFTKFNGVVFNSETLKDFIGSTLLNKTYVLIPPCPKVSKSKLKVRDRIIGVNLAIQKGGDVLNSLSDVLTDEKFTFILGGWGDQISPSKANVEYFKNSETAFKDELRKAKLFVLPSKNESWGMAASEAIAMGVPVVYASHLDGVRENVGNAGVPVDVSSFSNWLKSINDNLPTMTTCHNQAKINHEKHNTQLSEIMDFIEGI